MFKSQHGNALFLILLAIALFAALSYAVTQSGRAGGNIDREKQMIDQAVSEQCTASVEYAVKKLRLFNGCDLAEISYELPDGKNSNPNAPANEMCHVFRANGGGVTPCGAYLDVDDSCDLEALEIGEKCEGADIIYAGALSGARLYTTAADQGLISWNNGSSNYTVTSTTSVSDGMANTNTLVGLSDAGAPYEAALACRGLGSDWYLPAENELNVLYTNHAAIGGFDTSGSNPAGMYWSSTESFSSLSRIQRFNLGHTNYGYKYDGHAVRCVRR